MDISCIEQISGDKKSQIAVVFFGHKYALIEFAKKASRYEVKVRSVELALCGLDSEFICGTAIEIKSTQFKKSDIKVQFQIITGHANSMITVWNEDKYFNKLPDYKHDIRAIVPHNNGVIICTGIGEIFIWDFTEYKCIQSIDLSKNTLRLFSHLISDMCSVANTITFCTELGDIAQIKIEDGEATIKRMDGLDAMKGSIRALAMVNMEYPCIIVGGESGYIYMYDIINHYLVHCWKIGEFVSALAALFIHETLIFCASTDKGSILFFSNYTELQARQKISDQSVNDLAFSLDGFYLCAACSDRSIYLFEFKDNTYVLHGKRAYYFKQTRKIHPNLNLILLQLHELADIHQC